MEWARQQVSAATDLGEKVVLQPVTNLNSWSDGVAAFVGMRVQANPAWVRVYSRSGAHTCSRWGISRGQGTVVRTSDSNSELVVQWEDGSLGGNVKAGKGFEYSLMTVSGATAPEAARPLDKGSAHEPLVSRKIPD